MNGWRQPRTRAAVYQVLIVAAVLGAVALLALRATEQLRALGIRSGFGFLWNRAGFAIGEAPPVPEPSASWLLLLGALAVALVAGGALIAIARRQEREIGADPRLLLAVVVAFAGPPLAAALWLWPELATIRFTADRSFGAALAVGALNTLQVSALALVLSTAIGLLIAMMRLSGNLVVASIGGAYVELVRNVPLLLHLFFWYFAVLRSLPTLRQSINLGDWVFLNNRGLFLPQILAGPGLAAVATAAALGALGAWLIVAETRRRRAAHGETFAAALPALALVLLPAALAWLAVGTPIELARPTLQGLRFRDAMVLTPEFVTLVVGLSTYHGAYNAEIIRSGIQSVARGQGEAAASLGLRRATILRRVVLPQALRLIIPPLISRYVGLLKSSSLAVAIGYPELVSVGHSISFATSQAIEIAVLTMGFYLVTSLAIALAMNRLNLRIVAEHGR